jgi:hypothetical protein
VGRRRLVEDTFFPNDTLAPYFDHIVGDKLGRPHAMLNRELSRLDYVETFTYSAPFQKHLAANSTQLLDTVSQFRL